MASLPHTTASLPFPSAMSSSGTTSYADHTADLYSTIYGNDQPERQSDVYTQNNMELFEKVWVAGRGTAEDEETDRATHAKSASEKQTQKQKEDTEEQQVAAKDDPAANISDWPEIPDQGPSSMLWTCNVCDTQMNISLRTEHLASEHPPKERKVRGARGARKKKVESDANTPTWHCELCDEDVNIFYTAEHAKGKKHVLKLRQSADYQYIPPSEEFIEHRAVYKPPEGEEVLAADDEETEEYPAGGEVYEEEESAVYKPEKGEEGYDDWEPDGNADGGEKLEESAVFKPGKEKGEEKKKEEEEEEEEEEDEDWEVEDSKVYRPLSHKSQRSGFHGRQNQIRAPIPPPPPPPAVPYPARKLAAVGYLRQPPAGITQYPPHPPVQQATQYPVPQPQQPPSQPRYNQYLSKMSGGNGQAQDPLNSQTAIHIQVPTFYCDLCDTDFPISEQNQHSEATFECAVCDEEYHANEHAAHLASENHKENARAHGYAPMHAMPMAEYLPPPPVLPPAPAPASAAAAAPKPLRFHCELCDKTMGADSRASHLAGSKHKAKQQEFAAAHAARKAQRRASAPPIAAPQARAEPPRGFLGVFGAPQNYYCALCQTSVSLAIRDAHLASPTHKEREAAKEREQLVPSDSASSSGRVTDTIYCEACKRTISVNAWPYHVAGRTHKDKEEKSAIGTHRKSASTSNVARSTSSQDSSPASRHWDPTPGAGRPGGPVAAPQIIQYRVEQFHCKPCGISMHFNNKETHLGGNKHGEAVANMSQGRAGPQNSGASSSGTIAPLTVVSPPESVPLQTHYHCQPCNITMTLAEYQNHKYGKKHRNNEAKQNGNAVPVAPAPAKSRGAASQSSPRNIATEMQVTKVDGDLVVDVLKMDKDIRTGWCGICQEEVLRTTESHRSVAWKCDLCGITTHAAWKDLHMNTHDQRRSVVRKGGNAYRML